MTEYEEVVLEIKKSLQVDDDDVRRISKLPQRSPEWMTARENRITGSRIGALIGMNQYQDADSALKDLLWGSTFTGNAATRRGTRLEPHAAKSLIRKMRALHGVDVNLAIPGLIVCKSDPIFAYSPDGVLVFGDGKKVLVEIKAPFNRKPYDIIPRQYFCQVQLGMWVMGLSECLFVQYCGEGNGVADDDKTLMSTITRNDNFIQNVMLPAANKFYYERFLPLKVAILQDKGTGSKIKKYQLFLRTSLEVGTSFPKC